MSDPLSELKPEDLAAFYKRLAEFALAANEAAKRDGRDYVSTPLAPVMLLKWLENRSTSTVFAVDPPSHLRQSAEVASALSFHRRVFLTEEKARLGVGGSTTTRWAGALPRLQGTLGFTRWIPGTPLKMEYESNVQFGGGPLDIARIQLQGTPQEKDLFTSLRGWTLKSTVFAGAAPIAGNKVRVAFTSWVASGTDYYDFSKVKGLTLPNPDFGSKAPTAISPGERMVKVEHVNAIRLEDAGLACPYRVEIKAWSPTDPALKQPSEVDLARAL